MPKYRNFKLVAVLLLSLFLIACGGGKTNDPEQTPPPQVSITSAQINLEKVSIDLNQDNSANVVLTRTFNDESQAKINLVIVWDAENLVLKDESDNVIALEFDKDALLAGEAEIKFQDPESNLDIDFILELVPEEIEPAITEVSINLEKLTIDLNSSDTSSVNLISKYDDNSEISEQLTFSWAKESDSLILKNSNDTVIDLNYDSSSLNKNSIPVTFIDPVSNIELSIEIVVVEEVVDPVDPIELSIKKYVLTPDNVELSIGEETVLNLSVIMSDDSPGSIPDDVICRPESVSDVVSVTSDCKVTALQAGEVKVTVSRTEAIDDSLIDKANVSVLAQPEPVVTISKVEINEKNPTLIEGLELPLTLTVTYSNGKIEDNQFDKVECRSSSSLIHITSNCIVTGISSGKATIDLIMLTSDTPTLIGSEIEIIPPSITQLRMSPQNIFLQKGDSQLFKVIADYNNDTSADVTADSSCLVSSDVVSVTEFCDVTAEKNGSAEINPVLKDGTVVDVVLTASIEVSEAIVLYSGDYVMLSVEDFGGGPDAKVSCSTEFAFDLGLEPNCEIFASFPGSYQVSATLRNANTNEFIETVTRPIVVKAVSLGDFSQQSEFNVTIPADVYDIVYEISNMTMNEAYKVTLFDPFLSPNIEMVVLADLTSGKTCRNTVPSDTLEYKVACGVATTSDKIYIHITPTPFDIVTGLTAKVSVVPDSNILKYDGPLNVGIGSNLAYIGAYKFVPLTVGETLVDGHVPANLDGLNVSRYASSLELGMNPAENAGNFYTVSITFDSPNFDSRSAIIRWYSGAAGEETGEPALQCIPQIDPIKANTLTCSTINNIGQANIFVEVHGNGVDNLGLSNITAVDGEIGYSINLTQSPPP